MQYDLELMPRDSGYWQCYDSTPEERAANRSLQEKAQRCLLKVGKLEKDGKLTEGNLRKLLVSFVASWERMCDAKSYHHSGVSDTEPRGAVLDFCGSIYGKFFDIHNRWAFEDNLLADGYRAAHK